VGEDLELLVGDQALEVDVLFLELLESLGCGVRKLDRLYAATLYS
jgi:hypothetical protein